MQAFPTSSGPLPPQNPYSSQPLFPIQTPINPPADPSQPHCDIPVQVSSDSPAQFVFDHLLECQGSGHQYQPPAAQDARHHANLTDGAGALSTPFDATFDEICAVIQAMQPQQPQQSDAVHSIGGYFSLPFSDCGRQNRDHNMK